MSQAPRSLLLVGPRYAVFGMLLAFFVAWLQIISRLVFTSGLTSGVYRDILIGEGSNRYGWPRIC